MPSISDIHKKLGLNIENGLFIIKNISVSSNINLIEWIGILRKQVLCHGQEQPSAKSQQGYSLYKKLICMNLIEKLVRGIGMIFYNLGNQNQRVKPNTLANCNFVSNLSVDSQVFDDWRRQKNWNSGKIRKPWQNLAGVPPGAYSQAEHGLI